MPPPLLPPIPPALMPLSQPIPLALLPPSPLMPPPVSRPIPPPALKILYQCSVLVDQNPGRLQKYEIYLFFIFDRISPFHIFVSQPMICETLRTFFVSDFFRNFRIRRRRNSPKTVSWKIGTAAGISVLFVKKL